MAARGWREGRWSGELFNRYRVSAEKDEKILEGDGGDGCPTMETNLMPLNHILESC